MSGKGKIIVNWENYSRQEELYLERQKEEQNLEFNIQLFFKRQA